jgi:hypothetical protein
MHMGLLTALADLISVIIYPDNAKTFMLKNEESKKSLQVSTALQLNTVNNSQGGLQLQPIRMEEQRDGGDSSRKDNEHKLGAGVDK